MPGFVRRHVGFWLDIIFKEHALRDTVVLYLCDGGDLPDLLRGYRGPSSAGLYDVIRFPGAVFHQRITPMFTRFVDDEVRALGFRVPYQRVMGFLISSTIAQGRAAIT